MRRLSEPSIVRLAAVCGAVLLGYAALFVEHQFISPVQALYAAAIVALGAIPGLLALLNKREKTLIPLMPLHGIFYALTFGLPAFSDATTWLAPSEDDITSALALAVMGILCLYLGYYGSRKVFQRLKPIHTSVVPIGRQVRAAWILFAFYVGFQVFPELRNLPSVSQLSAPLSYLPLGILGSLALEGRLPRGHFSMFIIAAGFTLLTHITSGSLAPAVLFLAFFTIIYWSRRRRVPWLPIMAAIVIVVVLNPVKQQYREVVWQRGTQMSHVEKLGALGTALQNYYSGPGLSGITDDITVINRLAHISLFGHVISLTPESVPYWDGDSYQTLWTSFIPRALWADKPQATIGQDFGHRYFLLGSDDYWTSINLPWLVEFYANFGVFGVVLGMFSVGLFFRFLVQKLNAPVTAPLEHVLSVTVVFGLFYAESNLALMAGGLLTTYIVFMLLLRFLTLGRGKAVGLPAVPR